MLRYFSSELFRSTDIIFNHHPPPPFLYILTFSIFLFLLHFPVPLLHSLYKSIMHIHIYLLWLMSAYILYICVSFYLLNIQWNVINEWKEIFLRLGLTHCKRYLFPLPCGAGSTVPREGFDSSVIMPFSWCVVASYIVSVHIQCQDSIYTLSLCRGHSWRVRLAKQETLTPLGHLVSPLVCRGPWMSIVVLYCWCHSDSASVLLYFTLTIGFEY